MSPEQMPLSQRLKQLDEVQAARGMPEFDLDAVIRGGERRRQRRHSLVLGTSAAALVVAGLFTGGRWWPDPPVHETPVAAPLEYAQNGGSVAVSQGSDPLARVTVRSVSLDASGRGTVVLLVDADGDFTVQPSDFVWAGDSLEQTPVGAADEVTVNGVETLNLTYDEVSAGELAWTLPGTDRLAAAWSVGESVTQAVAGDEVWYLQDGATVTAYQGSEARGRVTVSVAAAGSVHVRVASSGEYGSWSDHFAVRADDFVWSGGDLSQQAPESSGWRSLSVRDGAVREGDLRFAGVGEGYLVWAPKVGETAGVWSSAGAAD
ncbi:hypothetical protein [Kineosporia succinea]|uniref:DUF5666 domain-containing protein n=1 Tax=Kineosporia succinea TaxID=84632 RepID=A0ABT9P2L9_9ACTN|nr:hypothetical protein [Kineosporia succinea]MDP9826931.1 hypothetical protein [Kineosporia succinea]